MATRKTAAARFRRWAEALREHDLLLAEIRNRGPEVLDRFMEEGGWRLYELAGELGVDASYLSKIRNRHHDGEKGYPMTEALVHRIAELGERVVVGRHDR